MYTVDKIQNKVNKAKGCFVFLYTLAYILLVLAMSSRFESYSATETLIGLLISFVIVSIIMIPIGIIFIELFDLYSHRLCCQLHIDECLYAIYKIQHNNRKNANQNQPQQQNNNEFNQWLYNQVSELENTPKKSNKAMSEWEN